MRQTTFTQSGAAGRVIWPDDQFLTLALNTWISLIFSTLYWICQLFIFLILVGVELPLCIIVTLCWNATTSFLESS